MYCPLVPRPRVVEQRRFSPPGDGRPIVRQRGVRFLVEPSQIDLTTRTTTALVRARRISLGARVPQVRLPSTRRTMLDSEITGEREWWEGKGEKGRVGSGVSSYAVAGDRRKAGGKGGTGTGTTAPSDVIDDEVYHSLLYLTLVTPR